MKTPLFVVDAFANRPFSGNPAAVCLLPNPGDPRWMQELAREMNLSETAFLHEEGGRLSLRWFTPELEVDLCGHATLATAHVLGESGRVSSDREILFQSLSGPLTARRQREETALDLPSFSTEPGTASESLLQALRAAPSYIGSTRGMELLLLDSEEEVRRLRPDYSALGEMEGPGGDDHRPG